VVRLQVKLCDPHLSALEAEELTTRRYTNLRLPYLYEGRSKSMRLCCVTTYLHANSTVVSLDHRTNSDDIIIDVHLVSVGRCDSVCRCDTAVLNCNRFASSFLWWKRDGDVFFSL